MSSHTMSRRMSQARPPICLIAEPAPIVRKIIATFAVDEGYVPVEADTAAGTRMILRTEAPDLALISQRFEDGKGLDIGREVQMRSLFPSGRLFLMTIDRDELIEATARKAGFEQVLVKPFDRAAFVEAVSKNAELEPGPLSARQHRVGATREAYEYP
ncbi:MAG: response regulator [Hyphomicrobiaceae bacterium]